MLETSLSPPKNDQTHRLDRKKSGYEKGQRRGSVQGAWRDGPGILQNNPLVIKNNPLYYLDT